MTGSINKTDVITVEGNKLFNKTVNVNNFDTRTLAFQSQLRQYISGKFNINKYISINVSAEYSDLVYNIHFELIDEKEWSPNEENMKLIGKSLAYIHNYCNRNSNIINLPIKEESYNKMDKWLTISNNIPHKKESYEKRANIFKNINPLNTAQPKIPLHRDFKMHNILFDGEKYHLIDFDFSAVDYVSIEVMGFVADILNTGLSNVKEFLNSYFNNLDFQVIHESFVDDYLSYLCTNTFPFYCHELSSFDNLVKYRNNLLETLYQNRLIIKDIIEDIVKNKK